MKDGQTLRIFIAGDSIVFRAEQTVPGSGKFSHLMQFDRNYFKGSSDPAGALDLVQDMLFETVAEHIERFNGDDGPVVLDDDDTVNIERTERIRKMHSIITTGPAGKIKI